MTDHSSPSSSHLPPNVTITVKSDYDGYFEMWLREVLREKYDSCGSLRHSHFYITAGAFRGHDVAWEEDDNDTKTLKIDFYSVVRYHGGPSTCAELVEHL